MNKSKWSPVEWNDLRTGDHVRLTPKDDAAPSVKGYVSLVGEQQFAGITHVNIRGLGFTQFQPAAYEAARTDSPTEPGWTPPAQDGFYVVRSRAVHWRRLYGRWYYLGDGTVSTEWTVDEVQHVATHLRPTFVMDVAF